MKTKWVGDVPDPGRPNDVHPVPLLRDMADRLATAAPAPEPTSPAENS